MLPIKIFHLMGIMWRFFVQAIVFFLSVLYLLVVSLLISLQRSARANSAHELWTERAAKTEGGYGEREGEEETDGGGGVRKHRKEA